MRSSDRSEPLDLERDVPTTAADVAALRRAGSIARLDLDGYLRFLEQLPAPSAAELRSRPGPSADAPFDLTT